tara:strand:+ start:7278 stop:9050 length:1773 start_codon:yes stop_codon:yes gene_type:complete
MRLNLNNKKKATFSEYFFRAVIIVLFAVSANLLENQRLVAQFHPQHESQTLDTGFIVSPISKNDTAFLVVAADRGFLGNEEVRDEFEVFRQHFAAEIAFLPWEGDTLRYFDTALTKLRAGGAKRIAIVPLFISSSHPLLKRLKDNVSSLDETLVVTDPLGESFFAEEIILDSFSTLRGKQQTSLHKNNGLKDISVLLVGSGALDANSEFSMKNDLKGLLARVEDASPFYESSVVVLHHHSSKGDSQKDSFDYLYSEAQRLVSIGQPVVVVTYHLGARMDSMMDLNSSISHRLQGLPVQIINAGPVPHNAISTWMARESNRLIPLQDEEIGFVIMPHGSNINWNETIRQPLKRLEAENHVEYAFSMADPNVLTRAIKKLEARGVRGIAVIRVFAQESSFRSRTEFVLGLGSLSGPTMGMSPPSRLRSASIFATLGGVEDHPLFAKALLDRAREISRNPSQETILLLGHGAATEEGNSNWLERLESIASQMNNQAPEFQHFRWELWREDWPEKRKEAEEKIKAIIAEEKNAGRTALVIPARTALQGPEPEILGHLSNVRIGSGFAPHSFFGEWVSEQLVRATEELKASSVWP